MQIPATNGAVTSLAFSPDSQQIVASYSAGNVVRIWDAATGHVLSTDLDYEGTSVTVDYHPRERSFVVATTDGTVCVQEPKVNETRIIRLVPASGLVNDVAYTPEGRHLVTANGNGTIYVLRLKEFALDSSDER